MDLTNTEWLDQQKWWIYRQNMGVTSKNNEINQQTCFFLSIHQFESIKKGSLLQGGQREMGIDWDTTKQPVGYKFKIPERRGEPTKMWISCFKTNQLMRIQRNLMGHI